MDGQILFTKPGQRIGGEYMYIYIFSFFKILSNKIIIIQNIYKQNLKHVLHCALHWSLFCMGLQYE